MKSSMILIVVLILAMGIAFAQEWSFEEDFAYGSGPHGVVVTRDGKIWVGYFGITDEYEYPDGTIVPCRPIWIYNPDGSVYHKIYFLSYDGSTELLRASCRGLSLDNKGNVLFSQHDRLWRINYRSYEAMNRVSPAPGATLTEAACDVSGYIYITHVVPNGKPFYIFNKNFELVGYVADAVYTTQRSVVARPNGKDIFLGQIYGTEDGQGVIHYHSDNGPWGEYTIINHYQPAIWGQCLDLDADGLLWIGSYWNVGPDDLNGWYALDPRNDFEIVNQFGANVGMAPGQGPVPPEGGTYYAPRGVAWSSDFETMYTADFDGHVVKKWQKSLKKTRPVVNLSTPKDFCLEQNFPNPFNPITRIGYQLPEPAWVNITVYNLVGEHIQTLVDQMQEPGWHSVNWQPNGLASGIYFYELKAGTYHAVKKCHLIK